MSLTIPKPNIVSGSNVVVIMATIYAGAVTPPINGIGTMIIGSTNIVG